ncbi:AAA family ATPase [Ramlibacter sp. AN1133]|uniref:AAA family ATPase n=1 Tax=Ramlibacter sp. AN1133 TaxID=3133429 RepID=UPI0030C3D2B5
MPDVQPLLAQFDRFVLDEANARIARDGVALELPPRAFAVLCALARQGGRLVVKDALLQEVWGHQFVSESVLKTTVSQLRAALADDPKTPRYIETAPRRGYRFIAPLQATASPATVLPPAVQAPPLPAPVTAPLPAPVTAAMPAPMPAPIPAPAPESLLIARDAALAVLRARLAQAGQGRCQLVLLAGEPGIGKSTLVNHFLHEQAQVPQALGQCVEQYGTGEPYLPILEALNALCRPQEGAALRALMRQVAPTWLVQLPWYLTDADRLQLQREVAGATQQRMLRELGELLDRHTAGTPLILLLEDLHWSDEATVQAIGYLARRRGTACLLLLGTLRPAEVIAADHPLQGLRQELKLHGACEEIELESFSEAEVAAWLARRLPGQSMPDTFVRRLHGHTEGLPLFLANVVDTLQAEGRLAQAEDAPLTVPRNIAGVLERQFARLSPELQRWLGAASVAGMEFPDLTLAEVLEVDGEALRAAFDGLVRQQRWLRSAGWMNLADGRLAARFAFSHALHRHVLYQALGEAQRVAWHRRFGAVLERALAPGHAGLAGELAMHFERGQDPARAIHYLQRGAAAALSRFAPGETVQSARHGLALLARLQEQDTREQELELRVLEGVALAQQTVFSSPEVGAVFDRAQQLCDELPPRPAHARALHGLWWVTFGRGELQRARALAERILELGRSAGDPSLLVAGGGALGMTLAHIGDFAAARRALEGALAAYAAAGPELTMELFVQDPGVEAMGYLGLLAWWTGCPSRARAYFAQAEAAALRCKHPPTLAVALHMASILNAVAREYDQVLEKTRRIHRLVEGHWLTGGTSIHGWLQGRALVATGAVEEGLAQMRQAAEHCRASGLRVGFTGFHHMYADACRSVGRNDEAWASLEQGIALAHASGELCVLGPLHRSRAELLLARGDAAAAQADLLQAIALAREREALQHELEARLLWCMLPQVKRARARTALQEVLARYGDGDSLAVRAARQWLEGAPARA